MEKFCKMIEKRYELKEGTKTSYLLQEEKTSELTQEFYENIVSASPFFRRIGGTETHVKNYTKYGYLTIKLTSKSPDKNIKVIREFIFNF